MFCPLFALKIHNINSGVSVSIRLFPNKVLSLRQGNQRALSGKFAAHFRGYPDTTISDVCIWLRQEKATRFTSSDQKELASFERRCRL